MHDENRRNFLKILASGSVVYLAGRHLAFAEEPQVVTKAEAGWWIEILDGTGKRIGMAPARIETLSAVYFDASIVVGDEGVHRVHAIADFGPGNANGRWAKQRLWRDGVPVVEKNDDCGLKLNYQHWRLTLEITEPSAVGAVVAGLEDDEKETWRVTCA